MRVKWLERGASVYHLVRLMLALAVAFVVTGANAPQAPPPLVERVTSELVLIEAYVTDLDGHPLEGLGTDNFVLQVDGKVAPIASLEYRRLGAEGASAAPGEGPAPDRAVARPEAPQAARRFVLYFEDDLSTPQGLTIARRAALKFIESALSPSDQIALVAHRTQIRVLSDFTTDRAALKRSLEASLGDKERVSDFHLDLLDRERILRQTYHDTLGAYATTATDPTNALMRAGLRVGSLISTFAKEDAARIRQSFGAIRSVIGALVPWPGYKAAIYLGDGIPENPGTYYLDRLNDIPALRNSAELSSQVEVLNLRSELKQLIDTAAAGGVTVHTIDTSGIAVPDGIDSPGSSVRRAAQHRSNSLPTLALNTGGISSSSNEPLKGLVEAEATSRAYYVIGYAPQGPPDGRTHSVQLRVRKASARIAWRRQFVRLRPEESRERVLQAAHVLPELYQNLGLDLSVVPGPADRRGRVVDLVLHIPPGQIVFLPGEDGLAARLDVGLVALDATHGEQLRLSRNVVIRLGRSPASPSGPGLNLFHRTHLPAATDTITAVVTDLGTGTVGALRIGGPLRMDDDPAVSGFSIYSLAERSLWLEMPESAEARPTEATLRDDQLGPALKTDFAIGEPLACGFKLAGARGPAEERLEVVIRRGEVMLKTVDIGTDAAAAGGSIKASLPVEGLPAGDYSLLVRRTRGGKPTDLAWRSFRLRDSASSGGTGGS